MEDWTMNNALMDLSNVDTASIMPSSVSSDADVVAMLKALDGFWREIAAAIPTLGVLATIDKQPDAVVDKLAYQFHVDYYDASWPIERKRQVVINSIRLHRIAGTRGAVEDIISSIWGDGAVLTEWWEYGGEPGTFQVALASLQTQATISSFVESIRKVKRATDHLTVIVSNDVGTANINAGIVYHQYSYYRL